jgi:TolA-binding protein
MKRFLWVLLLSFVSVGSTLSQEIRMQQDPDELYYLANQQFREGEYPGCFRTLSTWFERSGNPQYMEEARFLLATVAYELDKKDASILLIQFIREYPLSAKLPKAYYLLGCTALNANQFEDALHFFKLCPEEELAPKEVDEYRFRYAYASLQVKDYETARTLFFQISQGTNRYIPSATYFLAYMNYAEGKIQEAKDGFDKVSDQNQYRDVTEYFNLQLLYIEGRLDEAISKAESMLDQKPTAEQKTELVRLLGAAWFDKGKYAQSQQYYQEYLALTSQINRSDLYRIGINYYSQYNYSAAINYLTQVQGKDDAINQSATFHIGLCYLKQNKKDQARMSFENASNQTHDRSTQEKALYNYALICYEDKYSPFNEQAKAFQKLLTEFPNSDYTVSANNYLSDVFLSSKDYVSSLVFIDSLPNPEPKMLQTKCRLLFLSGIDKYNTEAFADAQQLFTKSVLIALENNFPLNDILYWKGESNYRLGLMKEAAEDFKAFALDPLNQKSKAYPLVSYQLGYAYFNLNKYDDARSWFEKFTAQSNIKKEKTYTDALNRIGDCWFQAKDISKAEKAYQSAQASQKSGNDYSSYQLSICLGARKMNKDKISLLSSFDKQFPQSLYLDRALFELGNTYLQLKQTEDAQKAYEKLLASCPNSPLARKAHLELAKFQAEKGNIDDAIATYKKVIELYPGSEEAQKALGGLKEIFVKSNTVSHYLDYTAGLRGIVKIETDEEDTLAFQSAETSLNYGKTTEAIDGYNYYLNHFPSGAFRDESSFKLGRLLLSAGKTQEGMSKLDSLGNKNGSDYQIPAVLLLAEGSASTKNYAMALNQYQKLEGLSKDQRTRQTAIIGVIRSSYALQLYKSAIDAANRMLNDENPGTDMQREALYYRAMSLIKDEKTELAMKDLKVLSSDTYSVLGAEARFRLAECLVEKGQVGEAENEIRQFLKDGSPHAYWLARTTILLTDICIKRGSDTEARQYLASLKQNYKTDNDIQKMIEERLNSLSKRSN